MANLAVLDATGAIKYIKETGAGTDIDPHIGATDENYTGITTIAGVGQIVEGTVAARLPTLTTKLVRFKAYTTNPSDVYIGEGSVTVEGTATSTRVGWKLEPGDDTGWIPAPNLNVFYTIGEGTTDILNYIAMK